MTWELAQLDAEYQAAMIEKEITFLKRRKSALLFAAHVCAEKVKANEPWPSREVQKYIRDKQL